MISLYITGYSQDGSDLAAEGLLVDSADTYTGQINGVSFGIPYGTTVPQLRDLVHQSFIDACTAQSIPAPDQFLWNVAQEVPSGLSTAPQAAIADAPADAVTNYNVVTTLLGTLTGAVNTANAKQNDIATKLNTLLAELRTLGLISA